MVLAINSSKADGCKKDEASVVADWQGRNKDKRFCWTPRNLGGRIDGIVVDAKTRCMELAVEVRCKYEWPVEDVISRGWLISLNKVFAISSASRILSIPGEVWVYITRSNLWIRVPMTDSFGMLVAKTIEVRRDFETQDNVGSSGRKKEDVCIIDVAAAPQFMLQYHPQTRSDGGEP